LRHFRKNIDCASRHLPLIVVVPRKAGAMAEKETKIESPSEFLTTLGERLRATRDVDTELVDILVKNLLTDSPAEDAGTIACDAIAALAEKRALPLVSDSTDG
jgi:hypothetical protein